MPPLGSKETERRVQNLKSRKAEQGTLAKQQFERALKINPPLQ